MDSSARLDAAIDQLYAGAPEEFMATRKVLVAEAKAAGEKQDAAAIGVLRRPSLAAWVCNVIAREMTPTLDALLAVGEQLRAAAAAMDLARSQAMRRERDTVIDDFVRAGREVLAEAGRSAGGATVDQVRATAIAALADENAARALAGGALVNPLSYSGFGEVDVSDAVARLADHPRPTLTVIDGAHADVDSGEDSPEPAVSDDRDPSQPGAAEPVDLAPFQAALAGAHTAHEAAQEALEQAEAQVREAERAILLARQQRAEARRELSTADRQVTDAQEALDNATGR